MEGRWIAAAGGTVMGFSVGYALPTYARLPLLIYDPVARSWKWAAMAGGVPMGYYGMLLYGIVGALVGFALSNLFFRRENALAGRWKSLWSAWTLTLALLVMSYFAWGNWP